MGYEELGSGVCGGDRIALREDVGLVWRPTERETHRPCWGT